ncbi:protein PHYTOCHROME KINASE SUBSTRATE 1-like [Quillaja saponaria]|uniref:Protein PHYTOCHROME KINASE SUBSTRATE 1-like n=1 Tax=Quillaja saponaria TaxID=32244 RepID=A0AAD7P693_QUISA|nr:protein PHYTOCHROME KINASE SUBSTRATE 1-like [Quillaja saponaria]
MALVSLTPTTKTSFSYSKTSSFENNNDNHLPDASFSSYLNSNEEKFVQKLADSSQNLSPIIRTQKDDVHKGGKKEEDGEIGVFGAEKYFNGVTEEESPRIVNMGARNYQLKKDEPADLVTRKCKIQPGTPSVRSGSSWNSQSKLLESSLRHPSRAKKNKAHGKSFLATLGCICSDKNSVDICEHVGETDHSNTPNYGVVYGKASTKKPFKADQDLNGLVQIKGVGLNRENCFQFPTVNSGVGDMPVKLQFQQEEEEKPRKSLEVFGSPILEKRNKSLSIDKRVKMLSWDATPRMEEIEISASAGGIYNDAESDASSDLFEIESLTGKSQPFLARQASDAGSTTCYTPSEASIEWSVVTASAAEFSMMSDYEDLRPIRITSPVKTPSTRSSSKEIQRRRSGMLLGCKSDKAVRVAGDACRINEKANFDQQIRRKPDSFSQVTRFPAETKLGNFDSRHGQHAFPTHSLRHPHPPHAPHLLYIQ